MYEVFRKKPAKTTQKMEFSISTSLINAVRSATRFTKEIVNGKLHFCTVIV